MQPNTDGCPVLKSGAGRYKGKGNVNCNVKDARLKRKSRRPLQIQRKSQKLRPERRAKKTPEGGSLRELCLAALEQSQVRRSVLAGAASVIKR
jgi:hypothetical protein